MFAGIIEAIPGMLRYVNSELLRSSCVVDIYCFIVFTTESRLSWYATSSIGSRLSIFEFLSYGWCGLFDIAVL